MIFNDRTKFCGCVKQFPNDQGLEKSSKWFLRPFFVQNNILVCGRKKSYFPFQIFVGPDWLGFVGTAFAILIPSIVFITVITIRISLIMTYVSIFWLVLVMGSLLSTACSDPGIIFQNDYLISDLESPTVAQTSSPSASSSSPSIPPVNIIECTQCHINRPSTARHCYQCNVCVDQLDHHCGFMGKCIGKKNLMSFYVFVSSVYVHCWFVFGTTAYFIISVLIVPPIQHAVHN